MKFDHITYAGHSAIFIESSNYTIGIDPWLGTNPSCPPELKTPKRLDLIILTHGHYDHTDGVVQLAQKYGSKVAAIYELASLLQEEGVDQGKIEFMNKGGTVTVDGLTVTLTNAFHSNSFAGKRGTVYAGEPCGVVVSDGKIPIYHAGDTCLFSDMKLIGEEYSPKVALFPIGDRFTMGPKEASKAAKLVGAAINIPIHWGTFPPLTGTPSQFEEACGALGVKTKVLQPGGQTRL